MKPPSFSFKSQSRRKDELRCPIPSGCIPLLNGRPGPDQSSIDIFDGRQILTMIKKGYSVLDLTGTFKHDASSFIGHHTLGFRFTSAFEAFMIMGNIICGDAVHDIFNGRMITFEGIRQAATEAAKNEIVYDFLIAITEITFDVAVQCDEALKTWSMGDVIFLFYCRMVGTHSLSEMFRLALDIFEHHVEIGADLRRRKRGMILKSSWLEREAANGAQSCLVDAMSIAQEMLDHGDIDFTSLVQQTIKKTRRIPIPADAIAAVALAELGYVISCEPDCRSVLQSIAGQGSQTVNGWVALSNPGAFWLAPFRTRTPKGSLALNGRTLLRPIGSAHWRPGGAYLYSSYPQPPSGSAITLHELPSYVHVKKAGNSSFRALELLKQEGQAWNDLLEAHLQELESDGFPIGGVEASKVVRNARQEFATAVSWKASYSDTVLATPRVLACYLRAEELGNTLRNMLYDQGVRMFHPHLTYVHGLPLMRYLTGEVSANGKEAMVIAEVKMAYGL